MSGNSIPGSEYENKVNADGDKSGAAPLNRNNATRDAVKAEKATGNTLIFVVHSGEEYSTEPTEYAQGRFDLLAELGADLILSNHAHIPQGFELKSNGALIAQSLGNFVFDQERLETFIGMVLQVDMMDGKVKHAHGYMVYLEDYCPHPLVPGSLISTFIRRMSESSVNVKVYPHNGQAHVALHPCDAKAITEEVMVDVEIKEGESKTVIDLLEVYGDYDASLSHVSADIDGLSVQKGRDILMYGDFEDHDVDGEALNAARYYVENNSAFTCMAHTHRGAGAMCSLRKDVHSQMSVVSFRNRIRAEMTEEGEPIKDLTFLGYRKAMEAGESFILVRYYASLGDNTFGSEIVAMQEEGTSDWTRFTADLHMPADAEGEDVDHETKSARAMLFFLKQKPSPDDVGVVVWDDLSIISWSSMEELQDKKMDLETPHGFNFLRVSGKPGKYSLKLKFTKYRPSY